MAAANKFNQFPEDLVKQVYNMLTHAFVIGLCASGNAPVATNAVRANLTEISYTNASSRAISVASATQTSGLLKIIWTDHVLSASGGPIAAWRYYFVYNDTATSPADPNVLWYDYGSALTIADTESLTGDFDGTNGAISLQ